MAGLMAELGEALPQAKRVLIDERDIYMSEQIRQAQGSRIVAVVGAGHLDGLCRQMARDNSAAIPEMTTVLPVSRGWKVAAWMIPLLILVALAATGFRHGAGQFEANALYWILVNSIPAAIGAALAWAHPVTVAAAFCGAPFTSLTPLIGEIGRAHV